MVCGGYLTCLSPCPQPHRAHLLPGGGGSLKEVVSDSDCTEALHILPIQAGEAPCPLPTQALCKSYSPEEVLPLPPTHRKERLPYVTVSYLQYDVNSEEEEEPQEKPERSCPCPSLTLYYSPSPGRSVARHYPTPIELLSSERRKAVGYALVNP